MSNEETTSASSLGNIISYHNIADILLCHLYVRHTDGATLNISFIIFYLSVILSI